MDTAQTLEELLSATADGDRKAFRKLYDMSSAKLFGIVLRILKDQAKAEDVLQSVYLKVWGRAGSYSSDQGSPITWMATIARNNAIDILRATRPTRGISDEDGNDDLFRFKGLGLDGTDQDELEELRLCLGEMKGDDRNYVLLSYYEGYSREELATRFEVPVVTIKTRLRRGLIALRRCLERE